MRPRTLKSTALAALALFVCVLPAPAKTMWDINHGIAPPPAGQPATPVANKPYGVPAFDGKAFWSGQLSNKIPAGTVLTAILEDDVTSAKAKAGDCFALTLEYGFELNGKLLIPPRSKIICSVISATAARSLRNGQPGKIDISLQSLVFPDGRHVPIYAMIASNPNHGHKKEPKKRFAGTDLRDYGESLAGMAKSFVTGPGVFMNKLNKGNDFVMDKGDAIAVRLNRTLDIPPLPIGAPQQAIAPFTNGMPSGAPPSLVDPSGPLQVPGLPAGMVPAPPGGAPQLPQSTQRPVAEDPNSVFNQPVKPQNLSDFPDPF